MRVITFVGLVAASPLSASAAIPGKLLAPRPESPLAMAASALANEKPKAALNHLQGYDGPGRAYATHLRAQAQWLLGQERKARATWDALSFETCEEAGPSVPELEIRTAQAELLAESAPAEAAAQLLALEPDPARWTEALKLLEAAGGGPSPQAKATADRLLIEFPSAPRAVEIAKQLGPQGLANRLGTVKRRLARLRALSDANANQAAADESAALARGLKAGHPNRCEVLYIQGKTARKRRRYTEAARMLQRAQKACRGRSADFTLRSALIEVQVRSILKEVKQVRSVVRWMMKNHPRHRYTDDARFLYAELLDRKERRTAARKEYDAVARMTAADHAPLADWRLAWADIREQKNRRARGRLRRILTRDEARRSDLDRARYWLGRIDEAGDPDNAQARYERLAARPSFYGWMALERLRAFRPSVARVAQARLLAAATSTAAYSLPETVLRHPGFAEARAYAEAHKMDWAAWSLATIACGRPDAETTLAVALALDAVGATVDSQLRLRAHPTLLRGPLTDRTVNRWRAAYSRPYREELEAAADAERIDPLLLTALAREESTFDPEIVSWAGAIGLTQLMPPTAKGAYKQVYRARLDDLNRLLEPALNARLGARVLGQGIRSFKNPVLALGAYNGGHRLVKGSLPRRAEPFEVWIESFGVKETRRYMKRVTESWGIYRLLYHRKEPFIRLPNSIARRS